MPKIKYEEFINRINEDIKKEYIFIKETYNGTTSKMKIIHNICKKEFEMLPKNFLRGQRCPYCAQIKRNNSNIKIDNDLQNSINGKFELIKFNGKSKINI